MSPKTTRWVADQSATLEWFRSELDEWEVANAQRALAADEPAEPWAGCRDGIAHLERSLAQPAAERPAPAWPTPDPVQINRFLNLLGKPKGSSRLRAFLPKGHAKKKGDLGRKGRGDLKQIETWQREERGAYIVVANGGDSEKEITGSTAFFIEYDDRPKAWQLDCWRELGLPRPSMQNDTAGRSVHSYWVLKSPMDPQAWKAVQRRLLEYAKADTNIGDIPRVMRLPGTWHMNAAGKPDGMARIITSSGKRYSPEQIASCLPPEPSTEPPAAAAAAPSARPAPRRDHDARPLEQVREALLQIPAILPDTGQRERFRSLAWGLLCAVRDAGAADSMALALLEEHSPLVKDAAEYLKTDPHSVTAATFWHLAREAGWRPERARERQQMQAAAAAPRLAKAKADADHAGLALDAVPAGQKPIGSKTGKVRPSELLSGVLWAMGQPRLNIRTRQVAVGGGAVIGAPEVLDSDQVARLYLRLSAAEHGALAWPKEPTFDAVLSLASAASFDPLQEEILEIAENTTPLPMGDWERLDLLLFNHPDPIARDFMPRFMVAAIARLLQPGCKADQCPVLVGRQGIGKSEMGKALFGKAWWIDNISHRLDKDDVTRCHRAWCCELPELDGLNRRADVEGMKAFLSRSTDVIRRPYGRSEEVLQRSLVFWGTSNSPPLRDMTGNRRFACIALPPNPLPVAEVAILREAIWSRAVERYRAGFQCWSPPAEAEAIADRNADHLQADPWHEVVAGWLKGPQARAGGHVTLAQLHNAVEMPPERQNNATATRLRQIAESVGWSYCRRRQDNGERLRAFWPPEVSA